MMSSQAMNYFSIIVQDIYSLMYAMFCLDSEIVKPVIEQTIRVLKSHENKILSVELDQLLQEVNKISMILF